MEGGAHGGKHSLLLALSIFFFFFLSALMCNILIPRGSPPIAFSTAAPLLRRARSGALTAPAAPPHGVSRRRNSVPR